MRALQGLINWYQKRGSANKENQKEKSKEKDRIPEEISFVLDTAPFQNRRKQRDIIHERICRSITNPAKVLNSLSDSMENAGESFRYLNKALEETKRQRVEIKELNTNIELSKDIKATGKQALSNLSEIGIISDSDKAFLEYILMKEIRGYSKKEADKAERIITDIISGSCYAFPSIAAKGQVPKKELEERIIQNTERVKHLRNIRSGADKAEVSGRNKSESIVGSVSGSVSGSGFPHCIKSHLEKYPTQFDSCGIVNTEYSEKLKSFIALDLNAPNTTPIELTGWVHA